jgi:hypothetical protein
MPAPGGTDDTRGLTEPAERFRAKCPNSPWCGERAVTADASVVVECGPNGVVRSSVHGDVIEVLEDRSLLAATLTATLVAAAIW